jgi:eukaryotic-like serine/threonine-protein kinase
MHYPSKEDYVKAVQHSESFASAELRRANFVLDRLWQIPRPAAGTTAVVFEAVIDGEPQALRFFTRDDASSRERYDALQEHFVARDLVPHVAMSHWVDDGIRISGRTWPVLRMQWISGRTLNRHVEDLVKNEDTGQLESLAGAWRQLVLRLQRAEFAHGDLQHGNVLIDDKGKLRLVDFDCSWIGRFAGQPAPAETGHRNYQPEMRPWGRWMDTFSGLVIYTSLLALSKNPTSWHTLNNGENMLFRQEDFRPPYQTPAWSHLSSIQDPDLDLLAARLKECCTPGWFAGGGMEELLARREWWERTGKFVPASPTPPPAPASVPPIPQQPPAWIPPRPAAPQQPPAGMPTRVWWTDTPQGVPSRQPSPPPPPKKAGVGRAIGLASLVGLIATILSAPISAANDDLIVLALITGLLAGIITFAIQITRNK